MEDVMDPLERGRLVKEPFRRIDHGLSLGHGCRLVSWITAAGGSV